LVADSPLAITDDDDFERFPPLGLAIEG